MSNINRVPAALLGITDSQTSGVSPDNILRDISPSLDMVPLWLLNMPRQVAEFTQTLIGNTNGTQIAVPNGEIWRVHCVSATAQLIDLGGASYLNVEVDWTRGTGAFQPVPQTVNGFAGVVALDRRWSSWIPDQMQLFPSGCSFRAVQYQTNAASVNGSSVVLRVSYTKIPT